MKTLIVLLLVVIPFQLSAQLTLNRMSNLPRNGDCIVKQQVKYKSPGAKGVGGLWDFSEQEPIDENYKLKYVAPKLGADSIVGIEHRTMYYYQIVSDSLLQLGHENPTTRICYRKPETLLVFPLLYGRSFTDYFDGIGIYCNRLGSQLFGKSIVEADATGMMILPGGDTLRNVLRVHTVKKVVEKMKPISIDGNIIEDTIPFSHYRDSIDYYLATDSGYLEINSWRWYADGYRYPVFETTQSMVYNMGNSYEHFATSFYYPPNEQYYGLDDDPENRLKRERAVEEPENRLWNAIEEFKEGREYADEYVTYSFYMDETYNLHLNYSLTENALVIIMLYDFQGRQLLKSDAGLLQKGNYRNQISLSTYPVGEYLLQILVNGKMYGEKILKF